MGETVKLQGSRPGQFGLNDWLGQLNNRATPQDIVRTILPTQEMRNFQRRYRFDSAAPTLAIGERWTITWVIPEEEWWRVLAVQFINRDTANHIVSVRASIDRSAPINSFRASRFILEGGRTQMIYGLDGAAVSGAEYFGRFPALLQPRDILTVDDSTLAVVANQSEVTLVYELVPRPAEPTTRGLIGTVVIT